MSTHDEPLWPAMDSVGASSLPLYLRVRDLVLNRILQQQWKPGERLPPDRELAAQLAINRLTLGKALNMLRREGYLVRYPGHGTFVADALPVARFAAEGQRRVAVLFDRVNEELFRAESFAAIFSSLEASKLTMELLSANSDPARQEQQLAEVFADPSLAGALIWSIMPDDAVARVLAKRPEHFPLVFLDRYPRGARVDWSGLDDYAGGFYLGEAMARLGLRRAILFAAEGEMALSTVDRRVQGFEAGFGQSLMARHVLAFCDNAEGEREVLGHLEDHAGAAGETVGILAVSDVAAPRIRRVVAGHPVLGRRFELAYVRTQIEVPVINVRFEIRSMGENAVKILRRRLSGDETPQITLEASCALDAARFEQAARRLGVNVDAMDIPAPSRWWNAS